MRKDTIVLRLAYSDGSLDQPCVMAGEQQRSGASVWAATMRTRMTRSMDQ